MEAGTGSLPTENVSPVVTVQSLGVCQRIAVAAAENVLYQLPIVLGDSNRNRVRSRTEDLPAPSAGICLAQWS